MPRVARLDSVPLVVISTDVARGDKYKPFQVHELPQLSVLIEQPVLETRVLRIERHDRAHHVRRVDVDGHVALGQAPQRAGDSKLSHQT